MYSRDTPKGMIYMDLIKISDTKLKIMLTSSDMTQYDLHNDHISIADIHVRNVLRRLLEKAKEQTGFDGDMTRLYVQMYPGADGGCELFISKPEGDDAIHAICTPPIMQNTHSHSRALVAAERHGRDMCVYSFTRLEHLIDACKRLQKIGFCGKSDLFATNSSGFYLFLHDFPTPSLYAPDEYCFLGEYGNRENARALLNYIGEYARLICRQNAVEQIAQL